MTEATLFVGGRVYTGRRYVEALLVEGATVVAVGTEASVRRAAPTGADRRDLGSALVVPGLADAHLHLGDLSRERFALDLSPATSITALQDRIREASRRHPRGPLVGVGLDVERLVERRWPGAGELDAVVADRPVVLYHVSGHAAVVNTATLGRGPPGIVDRPDRLRGPEGLLVEEELLGLEPIVAEALPLTADGLEATMGDLVQLGVTAVGAMNPEADELRLLDQLGAQGRLPLRVRAYPPLGPKVPSPRVPARPEDRFLIVGVKGFLDGAFGPRTASLDDPYSDAPATQGISRGDDHVLRQQLDEAVDAGLAPALHAIGDHAVSRAARLLKGRGSRAVPARIEHASLTPPGLLGPLRASDAHLVVQPGFLLTDLWLRGRLGRERSRWAYAFRTLADAGIPLAGSSDAPYDAVDPWRAMCAAVDRADDLGRSANPAPDEALTETEAFGMYAHGAHQALGDPQGGRLEPGARADLVVLSAPRLGEAIRRGVTAVRETWVEGRPFVPPPPR